MHLATFKGKKKKIFGDKKKSALFGIKVGGGWP